MQALTRVVTAMGRTIEFALTGQADYQLTLTEFAHTRTINGSVQARLVQDELQPHLAKQFGIKLTWPVLVELKHPPKQSWKNSFYHSEGNVARYIPQTMGQKKVHQIFVMPGLPRHRFRALLGHELTHAFQRERRILEKNRALREGMARWIEYHLLKDEAPDDAERILKLRSFTFGKAVHTILDFEKQHGLSQTLRWLAEIDES